MRCHSTLSRLFLRCERGIAALEFAMIMPAFVLLVMGVIEMSVIMFAGAVMESATTNGARLGKTGYVAAGETRQQEIIADVQARTKGLLNPNQITVTTLVYSNFSQIGVGEPCLKPPTPPCPGVAGVNFTDINGNGVWDADLGAAGLGNPGDIVVYTVSYPWHVMTPILNHIIGTQGVLTLQARSVVRNEPYN